MGARHSGTDLPAHLCLLPNATWPTGVSGQGHLTTPTTPGKAAILPLAVSKTHQKPPLLLTHNLITKRHPTSWACTEPLRKELSLRCPKATKGPRRWEKQGALSFLFLGMPAAACLQAGQR